MTEGSRSCLLADCWDEGMVAHLIPTVNHERILIKVSFRAPQRHPPFLKVGRRKLVAYRADTEGRFWQFDVRGLSPNTEYELSLVDRAGRRLCEPWALRTFPAPESRVDHLRVLAFTCGGGYGELPPVGGMSLFLPIEVRQRLLRRALSFNPHLVIANGDHLYWDQRTWLESRNPIVRDLSRRVYETFGFFDRRLPIWGTPNERLLIRVGDSQIAALYGTMLRSVPCFFLQDDHDYFENDEADDRWITFPPDPFRLRLARAVQHLYYPEFLLAPAQPAGLAGASANDRLPELSECYGAIRCGRLVEGLLYDCRRFMTLKGALSVFVDEDAERWLIERTRDESAVLHCFHCPSVPFGWSAGKWGEWYPDVRTANNQLTVAQPKPYWQSGWFAQHQRIVHALGSQKRRLPLVISGDLHALAAGKIIRSGEYNFQMNPIYAILCGPLGTGDLGFPSAFRGTAPMVPNALTVEQLLPPTEKNGFTLIDFTVDEVTIRLFAWRPPQPVEAIDTLEPVATFRWRRPQR